MWRLFSVCSCALSLTASSAGAIDILISNSNTSAGGNGFADSFDTASYPAIPGGVADPILSNFSDGASSGGGILGASAMANANSLGTGTTLQGTGALVSVLAANAASNSVGGASASAPPGSSAQTGISSETELPPRSLSAMAIYSSTTNSAANATGNPVNPDGTPLTAWAKLYAAVGGGTNGSGTGVAAATSNATATVENQNAAVALNDGNPQSIFINVMVNTNDMMPGLNVSATANSQATGEASANEGDPPAAYTSTGLATASAWGYFLPAGVTPQDGDNDFDGDADGDDIDNIFIEIGGGILLPVFTADSVFDDADPLFDYNIDQVVDINDVDYLVQTLLNTDYGDFNLDGVIDYTDWNTAVSNFGTGTGWATGDTNGDATTNNVDLRLIALVGDADLDGDVDGDDILSVQTNFGSTGPGILGDADKSGAVDGGDLIAIQTNFGATWPMPALAVPEPSNLLLYGGMILLSAARRQVAR